MRGSMRQRKTVVRNLRAAPGFLTDARVDRLIGMLDALRAPRPVITEYPEASGTARKAPSAAESTAAPRASGSASPHRPAEAEQSAPRSAPVSKPKRARKPAAPAAQVVGEKLGERVAPVFARAAAAIVAPNAESIRTAQAATEVARAAIEAARERAASSNAARVRAAVENAAKSRTLIEAERDRGQQAARAMSTVPAAPRPVVRTMGVQNAAPAIAWLRSHGVSVKASSTTVFGTKYIASNEFGELDVAAIVALARRKGFTG